MKPWCTKPIPVATPVNWKWWTTLPLARTAQLMQDLYGVRLSQASIQSFAQEAAFALRPTMAAIAQAVQGSAVVHADETGIRIQRPSALAALCRDRHVNLAGR